MGIPKEVKWGWLNEGGLILLERRMCEDPVGFFCDVREGGKKGVGGVGGEGGRRYAKGYGVRATDREASKQAMTLQSRCPKHDKES